MKRFFFFLIIALLLGCGTIEYGIVDTLDDIDGTVKPDSVRQYNLKYRRRIGQSVSVGNISVPEDFIVHPDGETVFIVTSFPKIGILKTTDGGDTYTQSFFSLPSLDVHFGYNKSADESARESVKDSSESEEKIPNFNRIIPKFGCSANDDNKIYIVLGSYIFTSSDKGDTWRAKRLFNDNVQSKIISTIVTKDDTIVSFSENRAAATQDWGHKWRTSFLAVPDMNILNMRLIDAVYAPSSDSIYASIISKSCPISEYSQDTFRYFSQNEQVSGSAVYILDNAGKYKAAAECPVPVGLFSHNGVIYGAPSFPTDLYLHQFSDAFCKDEFYKNAKPTAIKKTYTEYLHYMTDSSTDSLTLLSPQHNCAVRFDGENVTKTKIDDFDTLYAGMSKMQEWDFAQFVYRYFEEKHSADFGYEYSALRMFKRWTGMKTNSPILYAKGDGCYYRIVPEPKFWAAFCRYAFENQIKLNGVNPFLKKKSDVEFVNPEIDSSGFPVLLQKSIDGKSWTNICDRRHISTIIDPIGNKRSGFYWYKNVEQKKNFKLQFSFGNSQGLSYLQYPLALRYYKGELYILLNYFTLVNSYKDLYIVRE